MICFARYARDLLKGARSFLARACSARRARGVRLSVRGSVVCLPLFCFKRRAPPRWWRCACARFPRVRALPARVLRCACARASRGFRFAVSAPPFWVRPALARGSRVASGVVIAPLRFRYAEARPPLVVSASPALRAPPLCGFARPRPRPPSPRFRLVCLPFVGVCICGAPRGLRFGAGSVLCLYAVCFAFALFACCVTLRPALCLCALRARCSRLSVRARSPRSPAPAPAFARSPRALVRPRSFLARSLARSASLHSRGALRLTADLR